MDKKQNTGHWITMYESKNMVACSKCNKCAYLYNGRTSAYCPHCGDYKGQAQADGEYILKKDVMCCIGQTSLHWELARKLRKLSSVAIPSAEPKIGHWILGVCDTCGYDWNKDAPIASVPNFCPNCGCRMFEPQEGAKNDQL